VKPVILVVDDEKTFRMVAETALTAEGYEVHAAASGREALQIFDHHPPDLVVLDRNLPDTDGLQLLPRFARPKEEGTVPQEERIDRSPEPPLVIMATAYGEVEHAVQALKLGAHDYLTKPLSLPELSHKIRAALQTRHLRRRVEALASRAGERAQRRLLASENTAMRQVDSLISAVARSPTTTVLIEGESGTGKQLVAQLIHERTERRRGEAFIEINAASLPEPFVESEIFGHERGAFTDARLQKRGLLELSDGGSLFLDEVAELSLAAQAKLLKVLETSTFRRLGGTLDIHVDVRFIAATHRDLPALVREGRFRGDLFHRLDVFRIRLPPLRERPEDLIALAREFLRECAERMGKRFSGFSPDAERKLRSHTYPGNVRELANIVERAAILDAGPQVEAGSISLVLPVDRAPEGRPGPAPQERSDRFPELLEKLGRPPTLSEIERVYLLDILAHAKGNRSLAARLMGVSYPTVTRKISEYGIDVAALGLASSGDP
jgi:two-component system, NtrC family, response regulator AtoC